MKYSSCNLERLKSNELLDLAKFVVAENFKHHLGNADILRYEHEINSICEEEYSYFENAQIFVSRGFDLSIMGSIRVLRWNYIDVLPIQRIFGINPLNVDDNRYCGPIWHIGRFAIKKGVSDVNLLKQLMVCAIAPVCADEHALAYAECDSKLLRVLLALGITARPLGNPVFYLGSETIPICMTHESLVAFYHKNKYLVLADLLNTNEAILENYTFV